MFASSVAEPFNVPFNADMIGAGGNFSRRVRLSQKPEKVQEEITREHKFWMLATCLILDLRSITTVGMNHFFLQT